MTQTNDLYIMGNDQKSLAEAVSALTRASVKEINILLDKLNYYIEHIEKITSSSTFGKEYSELYKRQQCLGKMRYLLMEELEKRGI